MQDEAEFAVFCADAEAGLHAQGRVSWQADAAGPAGSLDLAALRSACGQVLDRAWCYAQFEAMGLDYGPGHQGLAWLGRGLDAAGRGYVLAQVCLPEGLAATADGYVLPPSLLDSALQASLGLWSGEEGGAALPFALGRLEVLGPVPAEAWVQVRDVTEAGSSVQTLDADICDATGQVCVRLFGLVLRRLEPATAARPQLLARRWQAQPCEAGSGGAGPGGAGPGGAGPETHVVLLDAVYAGALESLSQRSPQVRWLVLAEASDEASRVHARGAQVLLQVQQLLSGRPRHALLQVLVADGGESSFALSGLLKSAHWENPGFVGQVIGLPASADAGLLWRAVEENSRSGVRGDAEIRYESGERRVCVLEALAAGSEGSPEEALPWKAGGVYVVTGGGGGLGLLLAEEITGRAAGSRVVLLGRSGLGDVAR